MTPTDEIIRKVEEMRRVIDAGPGQIVRIQAATIDGKLSVTVRVKPARI